MILKANCKINLGLDILRRRADGFHDLETVMFPVAGLYDEVEVVRTAAPGAEFRAEGLAVDCAPEENICLKAFRLMQRHYGVDGVAIRLGKRVPFGAGLGGGSSDGTAVLLAVNELFALGLSDAELIARAAELGSDTAFFVRNTPQLCKGRGEVMEPFVLNLKGMTLVIVKPGEGVSTREAYAGRRPRIPSRAACGRVAGAGDQRFRRAHLRRASGHPCRQRAPAGRRGRLRLDVGQRLGGFRTVRGA